MIYILDTQIDDNRSVNYSLQKIYGIGKSQSSLLCRLSGFSVNFEIRNLTSDQVKQLLKTVEFLNLVLVDELKKSNTLFLRKMMKIRSLRGIRRSRGLPVRGQRTHTNAKTSKRVRKLSGIL